MFESIVSEILTKYLGKFVKGLDKENLKIAIWGGDVVLKDLEIRVSALASFNLPVAVKSGTCPPPAGMLTSVVQAPSCSNWFLFIYVIFKFNVIRLSGRAALEDSVVEHTLGFAERAHSHRHPQHLRDRGLQQ